MNCFVILKHQKIIKNIGVSNQQLTTLERKDEEIKIDIKPRLKKSNDIQKFKMVFEQKELI